MKLSRKTYSILLVLPLVAIALGQGCGEFQVNKLLLSEDNFSSYSCSVDGPPTKSTQRRLTGLEIENSLKDLLGDVPVDPSLLPRDSRNGYNLLNDGVVQNLFDGDGSSLLELYEKTIVDAVVQRDSLSSVCQPSAELSEDQCIVRIVREFGERAQRRAFSDDEVQALLDLSKNASLSTYTDRLEVVLQAILASPKFLLVGSRQNLSDQPVHELDAFQIAELLSLFLWQSIPDESLMNDARSGRLKNFDVIGSHVERMIDDVKFERFVDSFTEGWFELSKLELRSRDTSVFPEFNDELKRDLSLETKKFFLDIARSNRPFHELLTADYSVLNQNLARFYGVQNSGLSGEEWKKIPLPPGRKGLLTHASLLIGVTDVHDDQTSPIQRGHFAVKKILCQDPGAPPGDFPLTPEADEALRNGSVKEALAVHRAHPACASCHVHMDPVGLGLEGFNNIGLPRVRYSDGNTVDTSSDFEGMSFEGAEGLVDVIHRTVYFEECFVQGLANFGLSRPLKDENDKCYAQMFGDRAKSEGWSFRKAVKEMTSSPWFLKYSNQE